MTTSTNNAKTLFPTIANVKQPSQSLVPATDTSWLQCSSFSAPLQISQPEKSEKKKRKHKDEKKHKKRKKHKSEKQKIIEFERKLIRIDPRSEVPSSFFDKKDEIYQIDTKGDPNNLVFGALYRLDIPDYVRFNDENPFLQEILKWKKKKKQSTLIYQRGWNIIKMGEEESVAPANRYWKGKLTKLQRDKRFRRITSKNLFSGDEKLKDFIPLELPVKKISLMEQDENEEMEQDEQGESFEEYVFRRTKEFNESTRKDPYNIEEWLAFVNFQDEAAKLQRRKNPTAIVEKKLSIYEKALKYNPNSIPLLSGHLRLSRQILPPDQVEYGWKKALKRVPDSVELWREAFLFKKSVFSMFNVTAMRETYAKALKSLLETKQKIPHFNYAQVYECEEKMLQIFYDLCIFEKQSGYTERAIALMQALIEINVFCPLSITTWSSQFRSFRDFWESEAPRIGEPGAMGWKYFLYSSNTQNMENVDDDIIDLNEIPEDSSEDSSDEDILDKINEKKVFLDWLKEEEKLCQIQWEPCRPKKDAKVVEQCAERIVMFEDIQDFMFPITHQNLQIELIFLLLELLGLSVLYTQKSINDVFVHEGLLHRDDSKHLLSIFEQSDKFEWKPQTVITNPAKRKFIKNIFEQCIKAYPRNSILVLCYLDFEAQRDIKKAKKLAKSFLKKDQHNLLLWNYYASLEVKTGNIKEAKKVYSTCLGMLSNIPEKSIAPLLFRSYAELELKQNPENAIHILCSCVENTPFQISSEKPSPTRILKARKVYQDILNSLTDKNNPERYRLLEYIMCFALLEHLTNGPQYAEKIFDEALKDWGECLNFHPIFSLAARSETHTFGKTLQHLSLGNVQEQYLWLLYLKYIRIHAVKKKNEIPYFTKAKCRTKLLQFLTKFPAHPVGLALLIELEQQSHISSRLRNFFDTTLSRIQSPVIYIFAIYSELKYSNSSYRIRSLFEKALENQHCRTNVMLWRMYIRFEVSQQNLDAAKKLFYRAIDKCAHSKVLWMDSVKLFGNELNVKEIRELVDLMSEKEVCLRSSIENFVQCNS